jgi:DNA-binding CsgD family transcriptional regulator
MKDQLLSTSSTQAEVLVLTSHGVIGEALVSALRQSGWDAQLFAPEADVRFGQTFRVIVGPIDPGSAEASVTGTLTGPSTIVLDRSVVIRGATQLSVAAGLREVLAALNSSGRADRRVTITTRHAQILQYVADGLTVAEASERLGITAKTVNNHLGAVYRRLGVENLTQAVLKAIRLGFVDPSRNVARP